MGKAILIFIIGGIAIFGWINLNNNNRVNLGIEIASDIYGKNKNRNICNSAASMLLSKLGDNGDYRVLNPFTENWFDGEITYRIVDTLIGTDSLVKINVESKYLDLIKSIQIIAWVPNSGFDIDLVKGAINTNNNVLTLGSLEVDGRDHDLNSNLVANNGKYGVWTTGSYTQGGASKIGGTDDSNIDHSIANPGDPSIIKTNQVWAGAYPDSPDKVLGGTDNDFPEGKLKSIAQSGTNGSQYTTNPSTLTFPLSGITYVENNWNPASINGTGILIVHNASLNAILKNLTGTFKGLIIADDLDLFKADVLGSVFALSPTPQGGSCFGNGNGEIKYSKEALNLATKNINRFQAGFGKHRVKVISWLE